MLPDIELKDLISALLGLVPCLNEKCLWEISYWLKYLNTWSPAGGVIWRDCGAFKRWSLAGGRLWEFIVWPHFQCVLCHVCGWRCDLSASCSSCLLPCFPAMSHDGFSLWNSKPKSTFSPFSKLPQSSSQQQKSNQQSPDPLSNASTLLWE